MLSDKMLKALNEQITLEFYSSNLYLQMSSWCEFNALDGCAKFLKAHAAEEMEHMQRLFTYVNETGGLAIVGQILPLIHISCIAGGEALDLVRRDLEMRVHHFQRFENNGVQIIR